MNVRASIDVRTESSIKAGFRRSVNNDDCSGTAYNRLPLFMRHIKEFWSIV